VFSGVKNKRRGVRFGWSKTNGLNKSGKTMKPGTRSLFEAVERFMEETYKVRGRGVFEA
jgi:hypothetical protein